VKKLSLTNVNVNQVQLDTAEFHFEIISAQNSLTKKTEKCVKQQHNQIRQNINEHNTLWKSLESA